MRPSTRCRREDKGETGAKESNESHGRAGGSSSSVTAYPPLPLRHAPLSPCREGRRRRTQRKQRRSADLPRLALCRSTKHRRHRVFAPRDPPVLPFVAASPPPLPSSPIFIAEPLLSFSPLSAPRDSRCSFPAPEVSPSRVCFLCFFCALRNVEVLQCPCVTTMQSQARQSTQNATSGQCSSPARKCTASGTTEAVAQPLL